MILAHNAHHECKLAKIECAIMPLAVARAREAFDQTGLDSSFYVSSYFRPTPSPWGLSVLLEGAQSSDMKGSACGSDRPFQCADDLSAALRSKLSEKSSNALDVVGVPAGRVQGLQAFVLVDALARGMAYVLESGHRSDQNV
jgi:hypothetical protein